MKILFTAVPGSGLFLQTVPLAWAARAAGHEVLIANNGSGAKAAVGAGLPTVDVLPERDLWDEFMSYVKGNLGPTSTPPRDKKGGFFAWFGEQMMDGLLALSRDFRPDLVVSTLEQAAGALLAADLDVPLVEQGIRLGWAGEDDHAVSARVDAAKYLEPTRERLGLKVPPTLPVATIDVRPPSMGGVATDTQWLMRYVPYNETRLLPTWIAAPPTRRRVCLSLGSVLPALGGVGKFAEFVAELSTLDIEILLALGDIDLTELGDLPDNVRPLGWMPLNSVLQTCSAIVHHGGSATTATPLVYGVPQLIMAGFADQPLNAKLAADRGVAISFHPDDVTPVDFRAALDRLLTEPTFAKAAAEVRDEIAAQPSPTSVVGRLESLVA